MNLKAAVATADERGCTQMRRSCKSEGADRQGEHRLELESAFICVHLRSSFPPLPLYSTADLRLNPELPPAARRMRTTLLHALALMIFLVGVSRLPAQSSEPAPQPAFNIESATRAYLDRLTPEQKQRSDAYFEGGYWLQLWDFLYGTVVAVLLLGTRLSARMRDFAN